MYANRILVNKMDLLEKGGDNPNKMEQDIEQALKQINPTSQIQKTSFSAISDLDWILNIHSHDDDFDQVNSYCPPCIPASDQIITSTRKGN